MNRADERGSQACPARNPRHDAIGATITPICVHLPMSGLLIRRLACILSILQPQPAASGPRGRQICGRGPVAASAGLASLRPEPDVPHHCAPRAPLSPSESQTRQGACSPAQLPRPNRARTRTITHLGCPLRRKAVCEHPAVHPSHHRASRMCLYLHTLHSTAGQWLSASQCHPSVTALSSRHSRHTTPIPMQYPPMGPGTTSELFFFCSRIFTGWLRSALCLSLCLCDFSC